LTLSIGSLVAVPCQEGIVSKEKRKDKPKKAKDEVVESVAPQALEPPPV
jgi:hypothetical protein